MNKNRARTYTASLIAIALISNLGLAIPATASETRYINVTAMGTAMIIPDAVRVNASVSVLGSTSKEALRMAGTKASAVQFALTANKIAPSDVATQSITVYPEYSYPASGATVLSGYRASQSFSIIIRSAKTAGAIVEAIVEAGGDALQVNGVSPFVLDNNKANELARVNAVKIAKSKASAYAKLLGVKLGRIIHVHETSSPFASTNYMPTSKADSTVTFVDLGLQEISVTVTVRWMIL